MRAIMIEAAARGNRISPRPRPAVEEILAGYARNLSFTDVRQLAHAVDGGQPISVEYIATSGSATVRTLSQLELDPPYLHAWCHLRSAERMFTLSRIHGVMPG
ncbi:WYL domain-containing protein [Kitasatospora sp. NPDC090091]|uniref:WYL domain-containing protein n=1 Tax=Kitasatospora sp. NPDC090091 TaxID=3364081 RepID=UPI0037F28F3E